MPKQTLIKIDGGVGKEFFLIDKLAYAKAYAKKEGCIMDEKIKQNSTKKPKEKINQFIIECLFNKYFEEEATKEIVVEQERVLVRG